MVNLSLMHRVKLDRAATTSYDDASTSRGPRKTLISLSTATTILNAIFLIAGAVVAATIDQGTYDGPYKPPIHLHKEGTIVADRPQLFFFWCTIPLIVLLLSVAEVVLYRRNRFNLRLILGLGTASVGLLLWLVQFGVESSCMHGAGGKYKHIRAEAGYCGFELRQWDPRSFWQSGLALAWYLSWCGVVMLALYFGKLVFTVLLFLRQRRGAEKQAILQRSYTYHSPAEEREMQTTNRDIPDRSGANTPIPPEQQLLSPKGREAREPSIRGESNFQEELPLTQHGEDEEHHEKEMV